MVENLAVRRVQWAKSYERNALRTLAITMALGGLYLLAKKRAGSSQPPPPPPPTLLQYHNQLVNRLEAALSYGNKGTWNKVSEECRKAGRPDLPGLMRKRRPEWAKLLDRA